MIVVKLGGSLYTTPLLQTWVDALAAINSQTIIIVPGGGPFADQVRKASHDWHLNEISAHQMAVLAMQQYACLIASLNRNIQMIDSIDSLTNLSANRAYVWLPYQDVMKKCNYSKCWQVTSDSLSSWLAAQLDAKKLCLIKSAQIDHLTQEQLIKSDIVDDYFHVASEEFAGKLAFYNVNDSMQFVNDIQYDVLDYD